MADLSTLADRAQQAANDLREAAEDVKRGALTTLVDLGQLAQEKLDEMPAAGDEPEAVDPGATQS